MRGAQKWCGRTKLLQAVQALTVPLRNMKVYTANRVPTGIALIRKIATGACTEAVCGTTIAEE